MVCVDSTPQVSVVAQSGATLLRSMQRQHAPEPEPDDARGRVPMADDSAARGTVVEMGEEGEEREEEEAELLRRVREQAATLLIVGGRGRGVAPASSSMQEQEGTDNDDDTITHAYNVIAAEEGRGSRAHDLELLTCVRPAAVTCALEIGERGYPCGTPDSNRTWITTMDVDAIV